MQRVFLMKLWITHQILEIKILELLKQCGALLVRLVLTTQINIVVSSWRVL